jgi:hypothetical protein
MTAAGSSSRCSKLSPTAQPFHPSPSRHPHQQHQQQGDYGATKQHGRGGRHSPVTGHSKRSTGSGGQQQQQEGAQHGARSGAGPSRAGGDKRPVAPTPQQADAVGQSCKRAKPETTRHTNSEFGLEWLRGCSRAYCSVHVLERSSHGRRGHVQDCCCHLPSGQVRVTYIHTTCYTLSCQAHIIVDMWWYQCYQQPSVMSSLHIVRACVRACVHACVHACGTRPECRVCERDAMSAMCIDAMLYSTRRHRH